MKVSGLSRGPERLAVPQTGEGELRELEVEEALVRARALEEKTRRRQEVGGFPPALLAFRTLFSALRSADLCPSPSFGKLSPRSTMPTF